MNLDLTCSECNSTPLLTLRGRLTLGEGARSLRRQIEEFSSQGHRNVFLDLSAVSYVDSSGLGCLVASHNSLKIKDGAILLIRVPSRIQELLKLSRLTEVFPVFEDEADASKRLLQSC